MSVSRVLIVDDHRVVAEGLVALVGARYDVVGTITDGLEAVDAIARLRPDVVLLDLMMPHVSGLTVLRSAAARGLAPIAIILTMHADPPLAVEALRAGARGFVTKETSGDELLTALDVVLSGGTYLASALTRDVVTQMVGAAGRRVELTSQQREVLRLVVEGHRAKEIGETLALTTRSVESIKYRMMRLLGARTTAQLVRRAVEGRLVPSEGIPE